MPATAYGPLPLRAGLAPRELHVSRRTRLKYGFPQAFFSLRGRAIVADFATAQEVAHRINAVRDAARFPESAVRAGDLAAAGLLEEIFHLVIAMYREQQAPDLFSDASDRLAATLGAESMDELLLRFTTDFPPADVYRGDATALQYLDEVSEGEQHREVALEELLLLNLANANPAMVRIRELFDDTPLARETVYPTAMRELEELLEDLPGFGAGGTSLIALLRAPALASPTSLEGQLDYVREHWSGLLGERFAALLDRMLRALDLISEERLRGGVGTGPAPVIDAVALRAGMEEYERFSEDHAWMPRVVLLAKSSYVWLAQLSKEYAEDIRHLDQVPDSELDRLAAAGFTGLWLIGLWERSEASRRIKHLRGDPEAVASAYSLYDYVIAGDLGGAAAYEDLRDRAWARGIRLASDMVPNHVGIDGRWVIEHPDWFLSLDHPPYPGYTFTGPDLSPDPGVTVQIEDHYWDGSDAAVVFKRSDQGSDDTRYIYHGNDGTSMPWNDTAQLDYLDPATREGVIQTILHVARMFPIIRFDAAMTLAKRHIQRLWYPPPGSGGAIPSRAQYGMTSEEFQRAIPEEFWREVVDRVAAEVPDTLLLAEAFWLMEGYFVRTLGMHRVYNSAFMHMLASERNAEYRLLVRNVLEFDPEVLKRFVNFMNNPDEETAVAQFGKDDKYFGVATVLSTMPGLPMFGHGQIEGYSEKYGMEFRTPRWDEQPDQWLIDRHRREIFPLLHRRAQFAGVSEFLMYDVVTPEGHINEDVFAYSNRHEGAASLVLYNNRFSRAVGHIKTSVAYAVKEGTGTQLQRRELASGLGLSGRHDTLVRFRDHASGLEYLRYPADLINDGFLVELDAFKCRVFLDFQEIEEPTAELRDLCDRLQGHGVPSIAATLEWIRLEPLHAATTDLLTTAYAAGSTAELTAACARVEEQAGENLVVSPDAVTHIQRAIAARTATAPPTAEPPAAPTDGDDATASPADPLGAAVLAADVITALGGSDPSVRLADLADSLKLHKPIQESMPPDADTDLVIALLHLLPATPSTGPLTAADLLERMLADDVVEAYLGVNEHEGVCWLRRESFETLVAALARAADMEAYPSSEPGNTRDAIADLAAGAGDAGWRIDRLEAALRRSPPPAVEKPRR